MAGGGVRGHEAMRGEDTRMTEPMPSATRPQIFVSYSQGDAGPALTELRAALDNAGYDATGDWMLRPGDNWPEALERLRRQAVGAVVLITPRALISEAISGEARTFYQRASAEPAFFLIPLAVDEVGLSELAASRLAWLGDFQMPHGPTMEARLAEVVAGLSSAQPPASPAESEATAEQPRPSPGPTLTPHALLPLLVIAVGARVGALAVGHLQDQPIVLT